jgi:hypothetical protein
MAVAVAPFLADFGALARHACSADLAEAQDDTESRIEAARAEGRLAGEAAARARYEVEAERARAKFEAELAEARSQWAATEGARLADELRRLEARLGAGIVDVLTPLLPELARAKVLDDLVAAVSTLLTPGAHPLLQVTGPVDLLDALRDKLGEMAAAVEYWPAAGPEIRIIADHTTIETALGVWLERLRETLR